MGLIRKFNCPLARFQSGIELDAFVMVHILIHGHREENHCMY